MTEGLAQEEPKQNGDIIPLSIDPNANHQNLLNGANPKKRRNSVDPDAQESLISSLRAQNQDLFSQVSLLNSKLVKSYDRVSDLEDNLHIASANLRSSSLKISHLELERTQHLSALNTGLLVEKSHVTTELNRLMEKATEEAARRGQAESARIAIEKELADLSALLFDQANTMVAEARFAKHLSERKVEDAERALKSAEEAVQLMQVQMQSMQAENEEMEKKSRRMENLVDKGKWVEKRHNDISISLRLLNSHGPYQDYLAFLSHLRVLRPTSSSSPTMTTLLPLPFIARLLNEDSEPTIRLDLAPSLNWLSRRSVLAAIYSGQLTIEPISAASLSAEFTSHTSSTTVAGMHSSNDNVSCALCGTPVFPVPEPSYSTSQPSNSHINPSSWSGSLFKKTTSIGYVMTPSPTPPPTTIDSTSQIYIFKLASLPTSTMSTLPISSLSKSSSQSTSSSIPLQSASTHNGLPSTTLNNQPVTVYPLCTSGWCLSRLRRTCTLWAFVRTGIVDKIWEDVVIPPTLPPILRHANDQKPSLPPRRRGLWGIASAIGERAASWSEGDKDKTKKPSLLQPQEQRRLPPPIQPAIAVVPPPLPKRNRNPAMTSPLPRASASAEISTNPSSSSATVPPSTTIMPPPVAVAPSPAAAPPPVQEIPAHVRTSLPPMRASLLLDRALNVPLPDSRPSTPPVEPPPITSSPVATGSGARPSLPKGARPPLPQRAAARGVRASISRSGTPVNGLESPVAHTPSAAENISAHPMTKADKKTGLVEDEEKVDSKAQALETEETDKVGDGVSILGSGTPVNGLETVVAHTPSATENIGAYPTTTKADEKAGMVEDAEKIDSNAQALETEETDKGQYVGDGSWEEKTWKELVRLREDMFWARVGGFRGLNV